MSTLTAKQFAVRLKAARAKSGDMLKTIASEASMLIETRAKINITDIPLVDTGNLRASISNEVVSASAEEAVAEVGTNVVYAAIHEFGGIIRPIRAKMLSWVNKAGERVFANAVTIPARPYLRPAADEAEAQILEMAGNVIEEMLEETL